VCFGPRRSVVSLSAPVLLSMIRNERSQELSSWAITMVASSLVTMRLVEVSHPGEAALRRLRRLRARR
jgi:hypothetical protein